MAKLSHHVKIDFAELEQAARDGAWALHHRLTELHAAGRVRAGTVQIAKRLLRWVEEDIPCQSKP